MTEQSDWSDTGIEGFKHGFTTVDGVRMHYVSGGKADGEVVVLFAGFPQSWYAWRKILPALGERYRVIAPDLPGQGDSDIPAACDSTTVAKLVRGLLQTLGAEQHYLVAHDVGAWVAYPYTALHSEGVKGLAILDTGIPGISLPDRLPWTTEVAWRTWHVAFHHVAELPEALIEGRELVYLKWFLQRKAANPLVFSQADYDEYYRVFLYSGFKGGLAHYRAATRSADQNRELANGAKLQMPVLAVRADQGSMPDLVAELQTIASNVRGTLIADCGHYIAEERPESLVRELMAFIG